VPLTAFHKEVAHVLAAHRNPESHVAGGAVINRSDDSIRYSDDLDFFHDVAESVSVCAMKDIQTLRDRAYSVDLLLSQPGHYRATVSRGDNSVRLDWTTDSAFRFFPVEEDKDFGYCLHRADLATNKVLALAGREEIRDFLDIIYLDSSYLDLGAIVWAACGKDPGYTPSLLLDLTNRHVRFHERDLAAENLNRPIDLRDLKKQWIAGRERAEDLIAKLPGEELGCLYLDHENKPVMPDPSDPSFPLLRRHFGSVRGAWPKIS
jgi:hypothetical protein